MSDAEMTSEPLAAPIAARSALADFFGRFETLLARIGDLLNPILVKEARQALKSRQFTITFILVLIAGWCWSIIGIAWMGPGVYWSADGPAMFFGYYMILAFPLIVIVPYGAFRSLASEREDRTYELLSITTLLPRQIVGGKLAGAMLQMMVYLSAISPCLAFTYLLRGLDILTIATIIVYLVLGSLGLSMVCLLLATSTTEKYQQVVLSVGTVLGLMYVFGLSCAAAGAMLSWNAGFDDDEFWIINAAFFTAYASYFAVSYLAATSLLSFVGSNRSTALRIAILIQQALFLAWMGGIWFAEGPDDEVFFVAIFFSGIHWYVMGIFMTGESPHLSPRVKRDLPQSFLGRAFLTWFNPGPASGYIFAVTSFLTVVFLVGVTFAFYPSGRISPSRQSSVLLLAAIELSYLVIFLGLGRMIISWLGKYSQISPAMRVLVHAILLFVGTIVPLTIQMTIADIRYDGYTMLQATNPFWTLAEAIDRTPTGEIWSVATILACLAAIVFMLNLPAVAEEVRQVRIAAPARVAEEDAEQLAAQTPAVHLKSNPWDD